MPNVGTPTDLDDLNLENFSVIDPESIDIQDSKESVKQPGFKKGKKRDRKQETQAGDTTNVATVRQPYPEDKLWPARPGEDISFEESVEFLGKFTDVQWSHTIVYMYRVWPVIWRSSPKFIDKISRSADYTYKNLLESHGGGNYKLIITDTDSKSKSISVKLSIPIVEAMPKLDYSELDLGNKENKTYVERLRNEGIINSKGEIMSELKANSEIGSVVSGMQAIIQQLLAQQAANKGGVDKDALSKSLDMVTTAYKTVLDTAVKKEDKDSVAQLKDIMSILQTMVQTMTPKESSSNAELFREMLRMQAENTKTQLDLMTKVLEAKTSEAKDSTSWIDEFIKYKEAFGLKLGHERPGNTDEGIMDKILKYGVPVVDRLDKIITNVMALRAKPTQGITGVATTYPAVQSNPMAQTIQPQAIASEQPTEVTEDQMLLGAKQAIQMYGNLILKALNDGTSGDDFAYQVIDMFGMSVHGMVASLGKDNILTAMKQTPEFLNEVRHIMPIVEKFVEDFINAPNMAASNDDDEGEESEAEQAEPVPTVVTKKKGNTK